MTINCTNPQLITVEWHHQSVEGLGLQKRTLLFPLSTGVVYRTCPGSSSPGPPNFGHNYHILNKGHVSRDLLRNFSAVLIIVGFLKHHAFISVLKWQLHTDFKYWIKIVSVGICKGDRWIKVKFIVVEWYSFWDSMTAFRLSAVRGMCDDIHLRQNNVALIENSGVSSRDTV